MRYLLIALIFFSSFSFAHDGGGRGRPSPPGHSRQWERGRAWDERDRDTREKGPGSWSKNDGQKNDGDGKDRGTSDYTSLSSYIRALLAIQVWNQMVRVLMLNPLDEYRRNDVAQAKAKVESAMANLEAEVGRGTITVEQLDEAKIKLSSEVDERAADAVVPLVDYAAEESAPVEAPRVTETDERKAAPAEALPPAQITIQVSSVGKTPAEPRARDLASAIQLQKIESQAARALPQADRLLAGGGFAPLAPAASSGLSAEVPAPQALPESIERVPSKRLPSYLASSPGQSTRSLGSERKPPTIAALERAIRTLPTDEPLGEILTENLPGEFKSLPDMMGGRILAGDFGPGIAGVRIVSEAGGFVVRPLTKAQLYGEYAKLALCWLAIFAPLLYWAYRLGIAYHRRREQKRLSRPRVIEAEIIS